MDGPPALACHFLERSQSFSEVWQSVMMFVWVKSSTESSPRPHDASGAWQRWVVVFAPVSFAFDLYYHYLP